MDFQSLPGPFKPLSPEELAEVRADAERELALGPPEPGSAPPPGAIEVSYVKAPPWAAQVIDRAVEILREEGVAGDAVDG